MSSRTWFQHLVNKFPEWEVEDYAGNNFGILKNFQNKNGEEIVVGVGELGAYVLKIPKEEKYINLKEYLVIQEESYRTGDMIIEDENWFVGLIQRGETTGEITIDKDSYNLFDKDVVHEIESYVEQFAKEYWIGGGY